MTYLETTRDIYKDLAQTPAPGLCCTTTPIFQYPGLIIPEQMKALNYGCGSTVHPMDLVNQPDVLYIGVGGGLELLQFAYFSRKANAITGVDAVDDMLEVCAVNLAEAERINPWFNTNFIRLLKGDALNLPVEDQSVDVVAQNCLFNIFKQEDLIRVLNEVFRVLKPHGRLVLSDPICEQPINDQLREDDRLRALCLTGCLPLQKYIEIITSVGFGTVEIRARRPYRVLDPIHFSTDHLIYIESVEICAIKDPIPADGPCVFTGKTAIYYGPEDHFDDRQGHILVKHQPMEICDKTAEALNNLNRDDILVTASTFHYQGGGCC